MFWQPTAQKTIVTFRLDRTGSMEAIKAETLRGFNSYLDIFEREAGDLVDFTLVQFDSQSIDTLCLRAKLSEVRRLTPESYQPRAYTPLIDACFKAIKVTEDMVAQRRDEPRVIVCFQTDGDENASRDEEARGIGIIGRLCSLCPLCPMTPNCAARATIMMIYAPTRLWRSASWRRGADPAVRWKRRVMTGSPCSRRPAGRMNGGTAHPRR